MAVWFPRAVLVKGFPTTDINASIASLTAYFTNKDRSGGGPLHTIDDYCGLSPAFNKDEIIVVFQMEKVTQRVLEKKDSHIIDIAGEKCHLTIQKCHKDLYHKYYLGVSPSAGSSTSPDRSKEQGVMTRDSPVLHSTSLTQRGRNGSPSGFNLALRENDSYTAVEVEPDTEHNTTYISTRKGEAARGATAGPDVRPKTRHEVKHNQRTTETRIGHNQNSCIDLRKIEVRFVGEVHYDILELYFETKKKSGGGPITNFNSIRDDAVVIEFESEHDAQEVLRQQTHTFNDQEFYVCQYEKKKTKEVNNATIIVTGAKHPLTLQVLELWLESDKNNGGPIRKLIQDDQIVTVEFENHQHAENMLQTNSANIVGVPVTFSILTCISEDEEDDENLSIVVRGFKHSQSEEILALFFENEKHSGGGELQSIVVDGAKREAILTFRNKEVADRVLKRKNLKLQDNQLKVERRKVYKWDGKSIEVHGIHNEVTAELLVLLFESRKRSGGGSISNVEMGDKCAVITYVNNADAQRVLNIGSVTVNNTVLTIRQPNRDPSSNSRDTEEPLEKEPSSEVLVLGVPTNATAEVLEMVFESEKKCGGGPVREIQLDKKRGTAVVEFEDYNVALRVASKETLEYNGKTLHLELKPSSLMSSKTFIQKPMLSADQSQINIEVTGIPVDTNEEFISLFFESSKRSGGGPTESVNFDPDTGTAVISFKDKKTVENVMKRYQDVGLTINKSRLTAQVVDGSLCGASLKGSCAIEVTGYPVNCTDDMIRLFFENRRTSGGDDIDEMVFLDAGVVITFDSNDVAARVCGTHRESPLVIDGMILNIKHLKNGHRPKLLLDETIAQPNTLFVQDIPEIAEKKDVVAYLQKVPKCEVQDIWFGVQKGKAIALFHVMPEYQRFYQMCCLKPLLGKMIGVQCIEKPKSIEVYNISKMTEQKLQMYFEHKRSGGDLIQNVQIHKEEDYAIITFARYGVAENVVAKKTHVMENVTFHVGLHYECLGVLPPGHDRSTPKGSIPEDLIIKPVDEDIIAFLANTNNRALMDDRLNAVHAQLQWPNGPLLDENSIAVKCILSTAAATKRNKDAWHEKAKSTFSQVYDLYGKDSVNVLQEGWSAFLKKTGKLEQKSDSLKSTVDKEVSTVTAVGKQTAVQQYVQEITKIKTEVEDAISRKQKAISEEIKNLAPYKIKFIQMKKFPHHMKQSYPESQINCHLKEKKITIKGLPIEVVNIKLQMYEMMNEIKSDAFDVSKTKAALLKEKKTADYLVDQFQQRNIFMMYDIEKQDKVHVYTQTMEDLMSGIAIMKSCILEEQKDVKPENVDTLYTPKFKAFIDAIRRDNEGELLLEIAEDASHFKLVCIKPICDGVLESIIMFLEENTILEQFINMDEGTLKYITAFKKPELDDICKKFHSRIEQKTDDGKFGICVKGTKDILQLSSPRIVEIASNIVVCTHGIDKPGMPKYFLSSRGRDYLESLEIKNQVTIIIGDRQPNIADMLRSVTPVYMVKPKMKSKIQLSSGHCIYVVQGDLTDYKIDVIVNAANEDMAHVGGIAKAIVDKGGRSIQDECTRFIKQRGRLLPGRVYASDAGKLPCRKIIHTVGPKWGGGYGGVENKLYEAVYATLEGCQKLGLQTIGIPAISSGVFGFPTAVACKTIIEALSDFCKSDTRQSVTEIHLVDSSTKVVNVFHEELCGVYGSDQVKLMGAVKVDKARASVSASSVASPAPAMVGPPYWTKGASSHSINSKEGILVTVIQGEIAKQQVDVIVNTTSKDLNLNVGGVSSSILKAAGPSLQQEVNQVSPGGVPRGQIAITSGANIACQEIYHGALPHWKDNSGGKALREFMKLCLTTAHASGMGSIAIPAIGTGNLGYPRDKVAAQMFDEVKLFSTTNAHTTVADIRFVVFDQPTVLSFNAEVDKLEKNLQPPTLGKSKRKLKMPSSGTSVDTEKPETSYASGSYTSSEARGMPNRTPTASAVLVIKDKVTIQVALGDITEESTDVIVNSTDSKLGMASQVSRAILRKGGYSVERECKAKGSADKNGIAVTGAGTLKCKHIIHVATPQELESKWRIFQKWGGRIESILKKAVELQCTSISIPALGTGTLSLEASEIADTMISTVVEFCKKMKDSELRLVRFVIYQDHMVTTFQKQLESCSLKGKGYMKMMHDYFWGDTTHQPDITFERSDSSPVHTHTSKMSFNIYANDQKGADEVTKKIEMTCNVESKEEILDSLKDQEAIKQLTPEQTEVIKNLEKKFSVKIEILKLGRINKIKVEGRHEDKFSAIAEINRILREIEDNKKFEEHAEILHKQVQWEFNEGQGFEFYPPATSAIIEKAYQDKKSDVEFHEEEEDTNRLLKIKVTFSPMEQIIDDNVSNKSPVRRKTPETISLPDGWDKMSKDEVYKVILLQPGSAEHKQVSTTFTNSMQTSGGRLNSIVQISRIQNPGLYQKYRIHKKHMEAANPPNTPNEKELWHGTSADALDEIHATGFNRNFCGRNGTAFGKGVYFATFASLSNGYAKPDANGMKHMYLSRVLTGEFVRGDPSFVVPPQKDPNRKEIKFDAVVDNEKATKIYVIFFDTQAYPEYLIQYT